MVRYRIVELDRFGKIFNKLPKCIADHFRKQFDRLRDNPYSIGKPLGYMWLIDLKNKGHRVYYLIYDDETVVLLVGVSDKKNQKEVILSIKDNLKLFRECVKGKYYKAGGSLV